MEFVIPRPTTAIHRLGMVSRDAWRGFWSGSEAAVIAQSRYALVTLLEQVGDVAGRLSQAVAESDDTLPRANAASVCRWELGRLRERARQVAAEGKDKGHCAQVLRHLDDGMTAAQILAAGYRFHSLDRICRGGRALDDHFEALARLRIKLSVVRP